MNSGGERAATRKSSGNTGLSPFHLAFPVKNLEATRQFYIDVLGCRQGRSSEQWVDFDFFGHQLVAHQVPGGNEGSVSDAGSNHVDGHQVPVPHFGVVLSWEDFQELADRLSELGVEFEIDPCIRFAGQPGEQATMFFRDPSGNALEFKAFRNIANLFAI